MTDQIINRGKGWYEVGGTKVRGYDNAVRAAQNGNGAQNSHESDHFTLERIDWLRQAGLQYGGDRDIYTVAGYAKHPDFRDYWAYYDRHPIAGRIVDMPAQTTWRHPPEIVEEGKEDGTEFTRAFEDLAKRLGLWSRLERADRLSRIGHYGVLLIGARGTTSTEQLKDPLPNLNGPEGVAFLAHYSEVAAPIERYVSNPGDPRFGQPELYRVDFSRKNARFSRGTTPTALVHWSRLIHIAEDPLEDDVFGRPILRRVLNAIFNDEKVDAASAEAFWQLADKILQLKIDPDARGVDFDEVDKKLKEIYHDLRRQFSSTGGELSWLGGDSPDPSAISEVLATKMASGGIIPKRILFGSERGELASSQDERNYAGSVSERQEHHAEPNILRALTDRLIEFGGLPKPSTGGYDALWPPLRIPSEEEIAERNNSVATAAKALTPVGGDPYVLVDVSAEGIASLRPSEDVRSERVVPPPTPPDDPPDPTEPDDPEGDPEGGEGE